MIHYRLWHVPTTRERADSLITSFADSTSLLVVIESMRARREWSATERMRRMRR